MTWQTAVSDLLAERIGLDASSIGSGVIENAVRKRTAALGLDSPSGYVAQLVESADEQTSLVEEVVVPESWFFRDVRPFRRLQEYARSHERLRTVLRILSLPCAGGEEPCSIAIALREAEMAPEQFHIDAVDISSRVLDRARRGVYGTHAFRGPEFCDMRLYFQPHPRGWEVAADLRALVHFREGNLLDTDLLADQPRYQVIFCRNLLIYLTGPARRRAVEVLDRLLAEDGILFVGHAETLSLLEPKFVPDADRASFAYRRAPANAPRPAEVENHSPLSPLGRGAGGEGRNGAKVAPSSPTPLPQRADGRESLEPRRIRALPCICIPPRPDRRTCQSARARPGDRAVRAESVPARPRPADLCAPGNDRACPQPAGAGGSQPPQSRLPRWRGRRGPAGARPDFRTPGRLGIRIALPTPCGTGAPEEEAL